MGSEETKLVVIPLQEGLALKGKSGLAQQLQRNIGGEKLFLFLVGEYEHRKGLLRREKIRGL